MNKPIPNAFTEVRPAIVLKPVRISKKLATRVNLNTFVGAYCSTTKGQKAPR